MVLCADHRLLIRVKIGLRILIPIAVILIPDYGISRISAHHQLLPALRESIIPAFFQSSVIIIKALKHGAAVFLADCRIALRIKIFLRFLLPIVVISFIYPGNAVVASVHQIAVQTQILDFHQIIALINLPDSRTMLFRMDNRLLVHTKILKKLVPFLVIVLAFYDRIPGILPQNRPSVRAIVSPA